MWHFIDESFWIAVCFLVFLYFAYRPVRNAIIGALDQRIEDIKKQIENAERLKQEATNLHAVAKAEIEYFKEKKQNIINNSEASISRLVKNRTKEIELSVKRNKEAALQAIEFKKQTVRAKIRDEFIEDVGRIVRSYCKEKGRKILDEKTVIADIVKEDL